MSPEPAPASPQSMPVVIRFFLGYALLILTGIGLSLRFVVDMAVAVPVSFAGLVVMALLAYDIFTITLVLQRKQTSRALALGLSSLMVPAIPLALAYSLLPAACFAAALAILLLRGLSGPAARAWLNEP